MVDELVGEADRLEVERDELLNVKARQDVDLEALRADVHRLDEACLETAHDLGVSEHEVQRLAAHVNEQGELIRELNKAHDHDAQLLAAAYAERDEARDLLTEVGDLLRKVAKVSDRHRKPPVVPRAPVDWTKPTTTTTLPPMPVEHAKAAE